MSTTVSRPLKIAVVGHVEHVTLGLVDAVPAAGDIAHLREPRVLAGGGGGLAFAQLVRSDAEVLLFTALGNDDAGDWLRAELATAPASVTVHAARRSAPHPRVVVMVDSEGRRTIIVTEPPFQPRADDLLPWAALSHCDAVYFTGSDAASLVLARRAPTLVATARRLPTLLEAAVAADVVVGSVSDPRENMGLAAYAPPPAALVLTDGPRPIRIARAAGVATVDAAPPVDHPKGDYGAGDSFAAALTYFLARGETVERAAALAGPFGAGVLRSADPRDSVLRLSSSPTPAD